MVGTQVSPTASPWARDRSRAGQQGGTRTVSGPASTGQRTLLCRQGSALVPPGPSQSSFSPCHGAPPPHCTQLRSLRTPDLLINRELQTLHCFVQISSHSTGRGSHGHRRRRQLPQRVTAGAGQGRSSAWHCRSLKGRRKGLESVSSLLGAAGQEEGGVPREAPQNQPRWVPP